MTPDGCVEAILFGHFDNGVPAEAAARPIDEYRIDGGDNHFEQVLCGTQCEGGFQVDDAPPRDQRVDRCIDDLGAEG